LLIELAAVHGTPTKKLILKRPLLKLAEPGKELDLAGALFEEERLERDADRQYWTPLRAELEKLRHERVHH
jgi:hypothetical protein